MSSIGKSAARSDAAGKVTGEALYPGDLSMPGMLFMKTLFAGRPHARIIGLDTKDASTVTGVEAIYTAADIPVNEYGLQIPDQPVLCGPGSSQPNADVARFVGDQVAAVVAISERAAQHALDLIHVEFEDLPIVSDPIQAMRPDSPLVHPNRDPSNVCVHYKIRKGDVEAAFAGAFVTVQAEYKTPSQEHAFLQPEAGLAYLDDHDRITVKCAGQWTDADRRSIAHALDLPEDRIRVIYPAIGGAFGGREDLSVQIILALAAWKLHKPIKIIWSRQESIVGHGKRHPIVLRARWAATSDGKLLAAENTIIGDAGAYMYTSNKVLGNAAITSTGPYFIPNVKTDVFGVYTNNIPSAAFRGFGAPQALFMAEGQMNKLAGKLGIDPVEFRLKNALRDGLSLGVGTPLPGPVSVPQVIEAAATKFEWQAARNSKQNKQDPTTRRGCGFAAGFKNVGFSFGYQENSWAKVELHGDRVLERAVVNHAGAEVGQGTHTVMAQMAAEVLGLSSDKIAIIPSDSAHQANAGSASASRMTFMAGNAIKGAAEAALRKWKEEERPAIAEFTYLAPKTTQFEKDTGYSTPNFSYAYAAEAVEAEVDIETGHVRLLRVVVADDVGKAINPDLVLGQIEGAVVQAQGYAITEDMKTTNGRPLTDQLSTYLLPTILDIPRQVDSVIVETPDPNGPWGARGLGEIPFLPLAPAIAAAVHHATGIWIDELPFTPERVLRALGKID